MDSVKPHVPHAAVVHLLLKLLAREPGADLLLKRQPPDARVLDPVDPNRIHSLADAGQRDRQRIHHETRVDAGADDRRLRLPRQPIELPGELHVRAGRICQLFRRRDDRNPRLEDGLHLGHHPLERRAGAQHDDVRLRPSQGLPRVRGHLDLQSASDAGDLAEIAADFRGIDVHGGDDAKPRPRGDLPDDGGADGPRPKCRTLMDEDDLRTMQEGSSTMREHAII